MMEDEDRGEIVCYQCYFSYDFLVKVIVTVTYIFKLVKLSYRQRISSHNSFATKICTIKNKESIYTSQHKLLRSAYEITGIIERIRLAE
jgi:hypothetical protein